MLHLSSLADSHPAQGLHKQLSQFTEKNTSPQLGSQHACRIAPRPESDSIDIQPHIHSFRDIYCLCPVCVVYVYVTHISQRGEVEFVSSWHPSARASHSASRRRFPVGESLRSARTRPWLSSDIGHGSAWGKSTASSHAIYCDALLFLIALRRLSSLMGTSRASSPRRSMTSTSAAQSARMRVKPEYISVVPSGSILSYRVPLHLVGASLQRRLSVSASRAFSPRRSTTLTVATARPS